MHRSTVLMLDDDEDLQAVMQQHLEPQGYKVIKAQNGAEFLDRFDQAQADIILLDLGLPDHDGLSLLSVIRSKSKTPVIVVSGRNETTERIIGLEMGADDYLSKPFAMRELSARIKALLRRCHDFAERATKKSEESAAKSRNLSFNGWTLNRMQHQLFDKDGNTAGLTSGEFKLLEAFLGAPHCVLSREQLFDVTREGKFDTYDRVIDTQIARIRKKIGDDTQNPILIKTIRGVGYMFCGDVKPTNPDRLGLDRKA